MSGSELYSLYCFDIQITKFFVLILKLSFLYRFGIFVHEIVQKSIKWYVASHVEPRNTMKWTA